MTPRTVRSSLAALLTAALLLAGCGDDAGNDSGGKGAGEPTPSASGADGTSSAEPGPADGSGTRLTTANFNQELLKAQQEAGSYRSRGTTTTAGVSATIEAEVTYEDGKPRAHGESTPGSQQQIETVVADGVVYLKSPDLGVPDGKWLLIDPEDPANAGNPLAAIAASADPEAALRAAGELDSLELVGSEDVDGVDADHYAAFMDTSNFGEAFGLPAEAASLLPESIPFDMWVDEDNRPVKFEMELTIRNVTVEMSQTYYDYGADVEVTVPDAADTVPLSESGIG